MNAQFRQNKPEHQEAALADHGDGRDDHRDFVDDGGRFGELQYLHRRADGLARQS